MRAPMSRIATAVSFGLTTLSIGTLSTLLLWSVMAQWPHWTRHGEPLAWFNVSYGLERLGLDLAWVEACRADPSWQTFHRAASWVLGSNLTVGLLAAAAVMIPLSVWGANAVERTLLRRS
ncbi:hypothetical protein FBZ82_102477 [Azospirillum brasilense]|uniref:Uncharacterized protein n=1 Tax=Azospirillum brasilense TaxID=192 RepID=A0A560BJW1_AZOBR|nr:hypothetical protein [Azospirillum brasilense]TWA72876.1 hypothetical protein FBZ82_102477 [Azospirillum brasilense]